MKTFKLLLIPAACMLIMMNAAAQFPVHLTLKQADILQADAGNDTLLTSFISINLGANPTAKGGTPPYSYLWFPGDNLSDSTSANPLLTVAADTTYTFTVIVSDSSGCTSQSSVNIHVITGEKSIEPEMEKFIIFPNPVIDGTFTLQSLSSGQKEKLMIIKNINGQEICRKTLKSDELQEIKLPEGAFSKGVMLVEIHAERIHIMKMIVL